MRHLILSLLYLVIPMLLCAQGQRAGINTTNPEVTFDVHGSIQTDSALIIKPASQLNAADSIEIARDQSAVVINFTALAQSNDLVFDGSPKEGQLLFVANLDDDEAGIVDLRIAPNTTAAFIYLNSNWQPLTAQSEPQSLLLNGNALSLTQDTSTVDLSNLQLSPDEDWTVAGNSIYSANTAQIGIGTASPTAKLNVVGGASTGSFGSTNFNNIPLKIHDASNSELAIDGNSIIEMNAAHDLLIGTSGASDLIFGTNDIARMYISSDGNLGVNVSAPDAPIQIRHYLKLGKGNGNVAAASDVFFHAQGLIAAENNLFLNADSDGNGSGDILFLNGTETSAGTELAVIQNNGRMGIGTSAPNQLLTVNGGASKPGGGAWSTFSDRRLKKEIIPFEDGLETLLNIDPVKYKFNGMAQIETGEQEFIGVIAQEVAKHAPYMVAKDTTRYEGFDGTDLLTFDPSAMVYLLTNAVKEQQKQIKRLETAVMQLKKEIETKH